jgi:hypothetical protein
MKRIRIALYVAMLLTASLSMAQTRVGDVVADIPFPFVVNGQTLPAGHYIVSRVGDSSLRIQGSAHQGMFVSTNSSQRSASDNSCKLVFHRYGDSYFLSQVWGAGNAGGRELLRSRAERELAAKAASEETTVVAAR